MMKTRVVWGLAALLLAASVSGRVKDLPQKYQDWLEEVRPLLAQVERKAFLALDKDYQRDAFIESFWQVRDPVPETRLNEFRVRYYSRLDEALVLYETLADDRARVYALNGPPTSIFETDCGVLTWPLELWRFRYSEQARRSVAMIFYQPFGGGPFKMWSPAEGHRALLMTIDPRESLRGQQSAFHTVLRRHCGLLTGELEALLFDFREVENELGAGGAKAAAAPTSTDPEWVASFHAFSTDVEAGTRSLAAELELSFPGPYQSRTRIEGRLSVPVAEAVSAGEGDMASYNFQLTGEVLRDDQLFESFRYRFDVPSTRLSSDRIALNFERALRPAEYRWVLRLEDLNGGAVFREERTVVVPRLDGEQAAAELPDETLATATAEAVSIELAEPAEDILSGAVRFTATVTGEGVAKVRFLLDGKPLLSKTRPPFSVDFDLGSVPGTHTVRVVAYSKGGEELATDELLVNPGQQSFLVTLVEPREGVHAEGRVRARADVRVPPGRVLDRLEFFVGDERKATLYQAPFVQSLDLAGDGLSYLRVVAFLQEGGEAEDWVIVNAPEFGEHVEVRLVELYAAVLDGAGLPVLDLEASDFEVFENRTPQDVVRFEHLSDLPLYAGLMIDTSASMAEHFEAVNRIGRTFLEETIGPRDRAAVITFSEQPRLAAAFTNDMAVLASALAGLRAERGTALWDSLVFAIDYFRGIKGQRALVLLSDGEDRRSRHTMDEALQFAQGSGLTIYTVALESSVRRAGKRALERLAVQTGGRAFFMRSVEDLAEVYAKIQRDLRTRYLLIYQSSRGSVAGFRTIEVKVADRDFEVRALRGYFP